MIMSNILKVLKLLWVNPTTSATAYRYSSLAQRLKAGMLSTMILRRLNGIVVIHEHKTMKDG